MGTGLNYFLLFVWWEKNARCQKVTWEKKNVRCQKVNWEIKKCQVPKSQVRKKNVRCQKAVFDFPRNPIFSICSDSLVVNNIFSDFFIFIFGKFRSKPFQCKKPRLTTWTETMKNHGWLRQLHLNTLIQIWPAVCKSAVCSVTQLFYLIILASRFDIIYYL